MWQVTRTNLGPVAELSIATRLLDRLLNQGTLNPKLHRRVIEVLDRERSRITAPIPAPQDAREPAPDPAQVQSEPGEPQRPRPVEPAPVLRKSEGIDVEKQEVVNPRAAKEPAPSESAKASKTVTEAASRKKSRRSFTEILAAFMEQSSIRWGELVGGLLVVGSSIALVISLWSEIASSPFIKFSIFITVIASLFGLGFYSASKWRLPTTSRGVLIIATLLVPLNFLAMAAFTRNSGTASLLVIAAELFSLALFLFLVYSGAGVFAPESRWMIVLATMGPAFTMLMAKHWTGSQSSWPRMFLLGVAPLFCYWSACGQILREWKRGDCAEEPGSDRVFLVLGIASFSTLLSLGLLFIKPGYLSQSLRHFAPLISLFAFPAIASAIVLLEGAEDKQSGKAQTAATSLGIIGALIMLAALVFAWPNPSAVIVTSLINGAACLAIAMQGRRGVWRHDLRLAHIAAIAHLILAFLPGANLLGGDLVVWAEDGQRLFPSFFSNTSGVSLILLFVIFAAVSEYLHRRKNLVEANIYGFAAVATASISIMLIIAHGFARYGDPNRTAIICAFYAAAAFIIGWRREAVAAGWAGCALVLAGVVQLVVFKFDRALVVQHPMRFSLLIFASIATIVSVIAHGRSDRSRKLFGVPFVQSALVCSLLVAPFVLFAGWMTTGQISARLLWLASIWLIISWFKCSPALFSAFQISLSLCVLYGVAALFGHQYSWSFLFDLKTMQGQAIALALLSLAWIALRLVFRSFGATTEAADAAQGGSHSAATLGYDPAVAARLLYPPWPGVDRVVALLLLAYLAGVGILGAYTGIIEDLNPGLALTESSRALSTTASGPGSWFLLLALALVVVTGLWESFDRRASFAMVALLACACLLVAGGWQGDGMTLTVICWTAAISFALLTSLITFRDRVADWFRQFRWPEHESYLNEHPDALSSEIRQLGLIVFAAPVLILTLFKFTIDFQLYGATPPAVALAGIVAMVAGPVLTVGLSFVATALRERSESYAFAAGLTGNLSLTIGLLLAASSSGGLRAGGRIYDIVLINVIATAVFSLIWIAMRQRWVSSQSGGSDSLLKLQTGAALFFSLVLLALADLLLFLDPAMNNDLADNLGGILGLLAVTLSMIAFAQLREVKIDRIHPHQFVAGLLIVISLAACAITRFGDGWIAYRSLMFGANSAAWLLLAIRWQRLKHTAGESSAGSVADGETAGLEGLIERLGNQRSIENWIAGLALATIVMILRGIYSPGEMAWTQVFSISICLLFAGLTAVTRQRGFIYPAGAALNFAVTRYYFWLRPGALTRPEFETDLMNLLAINIIALALPAIAWLALDLKLSNNGGNDARAVSGAPFHRTAARISVGLAVVLLVMKFLSHGPERIGNPILAWLAVASVAVLHLACLKDGKTGYAFRGLYGTGLIAIGMILTSIGISRESFLTSIAVVLPLYAFATSLLWRFRDSYPALAEKQQWRWDRKAIDRARSWLLTVNGAISLAAYALSVEIVLNVESLAQRLLAATASFAIPAAMHVFVRDGSDRSQIAENSIAEGEGQEADPRRSLLDGQSVKYGVRLSLMSVLLWGWAWFSPALVMRISERLVVVTLIAEVVIIACAFAADRLQSRPDGWMKIFRSDLSWIAIAGLASIAALLLAEAPDYFFQGEARVSQFVVWAVMAALLVAICACITFAASPALDPFDLDERVRMNYVYGGEVLIVAALVHARMTMPWMFGGVFSAYWPLIVMLLAFAGVGLGELFRRQGRRVLAEPLERTGILLPLLPVIGFWLTPADNISYSGLLLLVGLFYGIISVMRRSFGYGMLAVLAGNGGLWQYLYGVDGYGLFDHPQLWLIPVAASVLAAARLNRDRLTEDQMAMIRYSSLTMIYVSSTADIFINGVLESPC
jgi:hypothetical protein